MVSDTAGFNTFTIVECLDFGYDQLRAEWTHALVHGHTWARREDDDSETGDSIAQQYLEVEKVRACGGGEN